MSRSPGPPRWRSGLGVGPCGLLAFTLPVVSVLGGVALLAAGSARWLATRRTRDHQQP